MELQGRELTVDASGEDVRLLQTELIQLGLPVPPSEQEAASFGPGTEAAVRRFQAEHALPTSGVADTATALAINQAIAEAAPLPGPAAVDDHTVSGRVVSAERAGVGGVNVKVVDKNVGGDVSLGEGITDDRGHYSVSYSTAQFQVGKQAPDVQVRVFRGSAFLSASDVYYNASPIETIDVFLPDSAAGALPSEFESLTSAIAAYYPGALRDLKETDAQQDITYLANKTGWDARAVALAALADRFSAESADPTGAPSIPPAGFYALFRAGVPADESIVYETSPETLENLWTRAVTHGVVPGSLFQDLPELVQKFETLTAQKLLSGSASVGTSSLAERLTASGLDADQQAKFAEAYTGARGDPTAFWNQVSQGLGAETATRLQVDGKLSFLTINNAPLVELIHSQVAAEGGLTNPIELAAAGYHRADKWMPLLAGETPIPPETPGEDPDGRRASYAAYLAGQVRLSYPTASVAEMVKSGAIALNAAEQVHDFLVQHQETFELGAQPVEQYIAQNNLDVPAETIAEIKRLQRVYQITPDDQAIAALLKGGLDSAYAIARRPRGEFVESLSGDLAPEQATIVYDRAVHVHNTVLNLSLSFLLAKTAPGIGVHSPAHIIDPSPIPADTKDVVAYSTLESLFGSLDFCTCEHCRSVLSPAAYLVDLLDFVDATPSDADAKAGKQNPQAVLLDRRPDLQHLPLTCENTNTALPYIDIVNEALEYYIANGVQPLSLQGYSGHDTDGASSEDLLATPQFVLDAAYTKLASERFPGPLPFVRALEEVRRYLGKFDVPLPRAMEALRKTDDVDRGANPYGWLDISIEELRLSRAEFELLTDSNAVPLARLYGLADGTSDADVITAVSNAEQFAHRIGISYEELLAVLKTRFVNPDSDLIPKLERLGVPFTMLAALKTKNDAPTDAAFDKAVAAAATPPDPNEYGGDIKTWVKNDANYARIMGLITLAISSPPWAASTAYAAGAAVRPTAPDPGSTLFYRCVQGGTSGSTEPAWPATPGDVVTDGTVEWDCVDEASCQGLSDVVFRYADPSKSTDPVGADAFIRMARFLRLWRRLGWPIGDVDAAVCALYRSDLASVGADDLDSANKLDEGFKTLLPRVGVVQRVLDSLSLPPSINVRAMLACWATIDTHGDSALYRKLFLSAALTSPNAAFADNGYGEYLSNATVKLADHKEAVRAALNLTGDELALISHALGYDENTPLTLATVSAILRRGWLARKLKLSGRELLLLIQLTGIDPFAAPDLPKPPMLELAELVRALRDRAFKSSAALYLIWNQDLSGKSAPDAGVVTGLARDLRADYTSIDDQLATVSDPAGDPARARMTLVYGQEASDTFFALLDDTIVLDVPYTHSTPTLEAAITSADPELTYDDFRHRLAHTGLVTDAIRKTDKSVQGVSADFQTAIDALYESSQQLEGLFFNRYPELRAPYQTASIAKPTDRHTAFLAVFEPELARRRKRQQAVQRLSATSGVDQIFTQALLDPAAGPFPLHAEGDPKRPLLDDVIALEKEGLAVQFFYRDTATGNADLIADATWADPLPKNPQQGAAISGIWTGRLEAPETGFYNFIVETDADATVTLTLEGQNVALVRNGNAWRNNDPIEITAGVLEDLALTVEKVKDKLSVAWETPKRAREAIPARYLYPAAVFDPFSDAYIRFLKAASLAAALKLSPAETVHFATDPDFALSGEGWLNVLPVRGDPSNAVANALLTPLRGLLDYARIKDELAADDGRLIAVLEDPGAATTGPDDLLYVLTRWEPASLNALLAQFGHTAADLAHLAVFVRIRDAFRVAQSLGISMDVLIEATTNEPTTDAVTKLDAALRARYDPAAWRDVVRPINDELRALRRDALVAYILHQMSLSEESAHIDTPDKLFEYFLMDVRMDPCMETSRIRHALSSVQLFVDRCLMKLEPRVSPTTLDGRRWEWMKRYRVWEANRKVFLWPENWLEPELRDDQSPFFKEAMSELLQGDITEDRAATVLVKYLSKLSDVAKLEPCGVFYIPADATKEMGETVHVVARTAGAKRRHFYRRCEYGYWTPWEEIKLDIEDNPVVPVVWNDRLLLFWLRILKKAPETARGPKKPGTSLAQMRGDEIPLDLPNVTVQAVLCWSEYYDGTWQPTKTSDVNLPTELTSTSPSGYDRGELQIGVRIEGDALRVYVNDGPSIKTMSIAQGPDAGKVVIEETWPGSFLLYNTHSLPVRGDDTVRLGSAPVQVPARHRDFVGDPSQSLVLSYTDTKGSSVKEQILHPALGFRLVIPKHELLDPWTAPFLYEDSRHVFYVTTDEEHTFVGSYQGFGQSIALADTAVDSIGQIVAQQLVQAVPRPPLDGGPVQDGLGAVDTNAVQRLVTEDAYIHQALPATGVVEYDGAKIGPLGAL